MTGLIVDTASVPPRERLPMWTDAAQVTFEPMHVRADAARPFSGRVWRHQLGPLTISRLAADASVVQRTPELIRRCDHERFEIGLQLHGRCVATQHGRSADLRSGALSSWHSSRPYEIDARTAFDLVLVYIPDELLRPHTDRLVAKTAATIPGDTGVGLMLSSVLRAALDSVQRAPPQDSSVYVAESIVSLVRALYLDEADVRAGYPTRALQRAIVDYIETHLGSSRLRPDEVARAHHISRSYLDKVFDADGMGVGEWIRTRRLARIRRDLRDPSLAHETVSRIAARWGIHNAAYLARAFRSQYGQSPRECREDAATPGVDPAPPEVDR